MSWRRAAALVLWLSLLAPPASPAPRPAAVRQPAPSPGAAADSPARRRTGAPRPAPLSTPAVPPVGAYPPAAPAASQAPVPPSPAALRQGPSETVPGTIAGTASWYAAAPGHAAAGPALRAALGPGWRGAAVRVCAGGRCVAERLADWCQCLGSRLVDLPRGDFAALADPSLGLLRVSVVAISR